MNVQCGGQRSPGVHWQRRGALRRTPSACRPAYRGQTPQWRSNTETHRRTPTSAQSATARAQSAALICLFGGLKPGVDETDCLWAGEGNQLSAAEPYLTKKHLKSSLNWFFGVKWASTQTWGLTPPWPANLQTYSFYSCWFHLPSCFSHFFPVFIFTESFFMLNSAASH